MDKSDPLGLAALFGGVALLIGAVNQAFRIVIDQLQKKSSANGTNGTNGNGSQTNVTLAVIDTKVDTLVAGQAEIKDRMDDFEDLLLDRTVKRRRRK